MIIDQIHRADQRKERNGRDSQSRPAAALHLRNVSKISHNQTLFVGRDALDPHALSSHVGEVRTTYRSTVVNLHGGNIAVDSNETETLGFAPRLVQNETVSGIRIVGRGLLETLASLKNEERKGTVR